MLAVAETPRRRSGDLTVPARRPGGRARGLEKPGNVGAVLRSADAAGVSAVIVADAATDLYNPNCIRASLGTIFTLPVCQATTRRDARLAPAARGYEIFAARVDASQSYTEVDYRGDAAIVLGSEASGLSDAWQAPDVTPIRLPMHGAADSLNVSATAAVLFYEALRQRASSRSVSDLRAALSAAAERLTLDASLTSLLNAAAGGRQRVVQQHGDRQRADAAGHGRDLAGHLADRREIDVAHQARRPCG